MQNIDGKLTGFCFSSPPLYTISLTLLSSLMDTCENFLVARNLVKQGEFFTTNPGENIPHLIAAWIMNA